MSTSNSNNMIKTQKIARTPLSSIDTNKKASFFRSKKGSQLLPRKKWSQLTLKKATRSRERLIIISEEQTEKKFSDNDGNADRNSTRSDRSQNITPPSTEADNGFWSEEMESLLTLRIANPVYDSDDSEDDEITAKSCAANDPVLNHEDKLQSALMSMNIHDDSST